MGIYICGLAYDVVANKVRYGVAITREWRGRKPPERGGEGRKQKNTGEIRGLAMGIVVPPPDNQTMSRDMWQLVVCGGEQLVYYT